MFTARAATSRTVIAESVDSAAINALVGRVGGIASVDGLNGDCVLQRCSLTRHLADRTSASSPRLAARPESTPYLHGTPRREVDRAIGWAQMILEPRMDSL